MEALAISAANLDTIERNLNSVANELTGVITNVSTVNNQVTKVENQVNHLNNEVQNLVKEIRETTVITNARQAIMYNNDQIEKKYGYYDKVRRTTESLIDAIEHSNISVNALINLNQDLILNNPNYWLSNALASLSSWLLDDKINCEKELHNALKKDESKTSLFFCLVNDKLGRTQTSINWLNKYLSIQNPTRLDKDFITVLDLVATGKFGDETKRIVLNKINTWFNRLNSEKELQEQQINTWIEYIHDNQDTDIKMPYLENATPDIARLKNNLVITSSYYNILNKLNTITNQDSSNKSKEDILSNLIYEYEGTENTYQKDNLYNTLLIQCNGNREQADKLFKKQESIFEDQVNLLDLLSNIIINKESFKVSNETQKIALCFVKEYIIKALEETEKELNNNEFRIIVDDFSTNTIDGTNKDQIYKQINTHVNSIFIDNDKNLIVPLIIINILGIIGLCFTLSNNILSILLVILLIIANVLLFSKLNTVSRLRNESKAKLTNELTLSLERILAETIDYKSLQKEDETKRNELMVYLNTIKAENYINSNNERNIDIGE
ncbi:MAG: hypothetical protein E7171_04875 [Firmicutes bacterium]|nr:hypothetical protein [Bacillota bacterium]